MRIKRKNISTILSLTLLFGCTDDVTPPGIENIEEKVVVNAVISPDVPLIMAQVSISKKAFGIVSDPFGDSDLITNAEVTISNGTDTRTLPYDSDLMHYARSTDLFSIVEGITYRLEVTTDKGTVYAEASLPKKVEALESLEVGSSGLDISISWVDIPGQENYYRVTAFGEQADQGFLEPFFFENDEFVSDINSDGQLMNARGEGFFGNRQYERITVRVISSDENYFDYFRILRDYVGGDDPFSDPVQLPSNVVGGIGLFSAVQVSEFVIESP